MRLLDGFVTTQLLYVAAKLGIAELLSDGPKTGAEIATGIGADPTTVVRLLRGLAIEDVLAETDDGRFGLTPIGESLRALQGAALVRGDVYYRSAAGLLDSVLGGGSPFERVLRRTVLRPPRSPPRTRGRVPGVDGRTGAPGSDRRRGRLRLHRVVSAHRCRRRAGRPVGRDPAATPGLSGVLLDRDAAIPAARDYLATAGLGDRTECLAGDFFAEVPAGADAYVLSRVIHDWDDAPAERILATCRHAMAPGSRLVLVEALMPERAGDHPAAIRMDLHMLLLLGARERTEAEFRLLLDRSGFHVRRVLPTESPAGLAVIEATPS